MEELEDEEVLTQVNEETGFWKAISKRRNKRAGHVMRYNNYMATLIEGRMDKQAGKGRPREQFVYEMVEEVGSGWKLRIEGISNAQEALRTPKQSSKNHQCLGNKA